jgi:hypothetical protein
MVDRSVHGGQTSSWDRNAMAGHILHRCYHYSLLRSLCKSISSRPPDLAPGGRFLHPDGEIRPSHAPGSSFSPGFGLSSIRRAQDVPGFPRRARGLRTKQKRAKRRAGPRCRREKG